ncbi:MAG TPA: hypothetical protein VJ739_05920, partial [Gemmataceae bacterium]|nr:hypothetical protein [Gemmataceae bacterium]
ARDADRLQELSTALRQAGAPPWPGGPRVGDDWRGWMRSFAGAEADGRWWALIEQHASRALAAEPDMGFGLFAVGGLAELPVVRCGAAKDLYQGDRAREAAEQILAGKSLQVYGLRHDPAAPAAPDPIAEVMVAGKTSIGRFGGALRRLLYAAPAIDPGFVADAQCLTEQATQKALSVKAGKPPLQFGDYERQLRRLLNGEPPDLPEGSEIRAVLGPLETVCGRLWAALGGEVPVWLEWLRKPHELAELLAVEAEGVIRLPLEDLRLRGWTLQ